MKKPTKKDKPKEEKRALKNTGSLPKDIGNK